MGSEDFIEGLYGADSGLNEGDLSKEGVDEVLASSHKLEVTAGNVQVSVAAQIDGWEQSADALTALTDHVGAGDDIVKDVALPDSFGPEENGVRERLDQIQPLDEPESI